MPRIRYTGATAYHGGAGSFHAGDEREVSEEHFRHLLANFPECFTAVKGAEAAAPTAPAAKSLDAPVAAKPAKGVKK